MEQRSNFEDGNLDVPVARSSEAASRTTERNSEEYAERRASTHLRIALENLKVARQNLRNSKFSPDAKLVSFYEGIAHGMESRQAANDNFRMRRLRFEEALDLIDAEDVNARVIGLEALCNLATIKQTKALTDWRFGPPRALPLNEPSQSAPSTPGYEAITSYNLSEVVLDKNLLEDAVDNYQLLLKLLQSDILMSAAKHTNHSALTKSRLELTANSGLIICRYALWRDTPSDQLADTIRFAAKSTLAMAENLRQSLKSEEGAQLNAQNPLDGLTGSLYNRRDNAPRFNEMMRKALNVFRGHVMKPQPTKISDAAATLVILSEIVYFVTAIQEFVTLRRT
ncbi:hypothetical protein JAO29_04285 [Edaphobacter sp. HDX4]|uniref:hypothetical protein n=1 Tax=Edaphobacter sp. HDX4 TaxID=2794064 RepID=UPI002FE54D10